MPLTSWKRLAYERYVSSEQGAHGAHTPQFLFGPRRAYIERIIKRHIPAKRGIRIADVGCGHGAFLYFLQMAGYTNVSGCDVSEEQVNLAYALGLQVEQCDLFSFFAAEKNGSLDVVIAFDVIEHQTPEDMFRFLREAFRVLSPGGKLILHAPNGGGLFGMSVRYGDVTHETALTATSSRQLLKTVGFDNVRCYEDKPTVHGVVSLIRAALWYSMTAYFRLLYLAETGSRGVILSQNFLVEASKPLEVIS